MFLYTLGLGCMISGFWLFYLQGPLLAPLCSPWNIEIDLLFLCFFSSMSLAFLLLAQVIKIRSLRNKKISLVICSLILSSAPLLTFVLPRLGVVYPSIPYLLAFSSGIAQAVFTTVWMEVLATCGLQQSYMITGLAFLLSGCITSLGQLAPYFWLLPVLILLPLFSLFCLLRPLPPLSFFPKDHPYTNTIRLFPLQLIISLGLIYINGGLMLHILKLEQSHLQLFHWSYLAYAFFCPIVGLFLYRNADIDLRFIYRLLLPMMLIGFIILFFHESILRFIAFGLLQGGSALLNLYVWLLFPYFSCFSSRPAAVCAYGNFIVCICILCGSFIANLLTTALPNNSTEALSFTACIISAILVSLFPGKKETFSGWQAVVTAKPPTPKLLPAAPDIAATSEIPSDSSNSLSSISEFPNEFNQLPLSRREKEVLLLLIRGRSGRFISESLNISSNTVKTHIRNIYNKLAVNNRQQLLSLFDNNETNIQIEETTNGN